MPQPPNENLFDDSKMSFGQHLEELRGALFKAVIALAVGTLVGLLCANWVVKQIEAPLKEGLGRFYQNVSVEHYRTVLEQRIERNQPVPEELKDPEILGDDEKLLTAIKAHTPDEPLEWRRFDGYVTATTGEQYRWGQEVALDATPAHFTDRFNRFVTHIQRSTAYIAEHKHVTFANVTRLHIAN